MGGIAKGIGKVVGSVTGTTAAANAQTDAANQSNATALQIFNQQQATLQPFVQAGLQGLSGLQSTAGQPIDRASTLSNYYNSDEYNQMANQARYQQLASSEATGGLGSTATSNGLAAIAPTLGQNYLTAMTNQQQNMYSQLLGLTNVGGNAAGSTNASAGDYSTAVQNNLGQIGATSAGESLANGKAITSGLGYLSGTSLANSAGTGITNFLKGLF